MEAIADELYQIAVGLEQVAAELHQILIALWAIAVIMFLFLLKDV